MADLSKAAEDVLAERQRQISVKGYTVAHDDIYICGELAGAAACYAMNTLRVDNQGLREGVYRVMADLWPWARGYWKPKNKRSDLVRAAALLIADIERIDRAYRDVDRHRDDMERLQSRFGPPPLD